MTDNVLIRDVGEPIIVDSIDQQICHVVAETLLKHYPGHEWLVEADRRKGFIDIRNMRLAGNHGFRIKMAGFATASELANLAMRAGGEVLERFNMPRSLFNEAVYNEIPEDFAGRLRFEQ